MPEVLRSCSKGGKPRWRDAERLECFVDGSKYYEVTLSAGRVVALFALRDGSTFDQFRAEFEKIFARPGNVYSRRDGGTGIYWSNPESTLRLAAIDGSVSILIEPTVNAAPVPAGEPSIDADTERRAQGYHGYMTERGWMRVGHFATNVAARQPSKTTLTVRADYCYAVITLGGLGVVDADVELFRADHQLSKDLDSDRDAIATFCTDRSERIEVVTGAYTGEGPLFLLAYERQNARAHGAWPQWQGPRPEMPHAATQRKLTPEALYRDLSPSVYVVASGSSQGSAVAVSRRHLVTNCHVIQSGEIFIKRGNSVAIAHLVRADANTDRCLLATEDIALTPVRSVRAFSRLRIGEAVYAIGAPRGQEGSLSSGIVSRFTQENGLSIIQTTAAISPGSSGGPLFDAFGNLIGVTAFQRADAQNLNFAIAAEEWWR